MQKDNEVRGVPPLIKTPELPPLIHENVVSSKGVFSEHKILIVTLAIIIVVTLVIILVYYFSKRDIPTPHQRMKQLEERKAEEKKLEIEEMKEREKIKKLNAARRAVTEGRHSDSHQEIAPITEQKREQYQSQQIQAPPQQQKSQSEIKNKVIEDSVNIADIMASNAVTESSHSANTDDQNESLARLEQHQQISIVNPAGDTNKPNSTNNDPNQKG